MQGIYISPVHSVLPSELNCKASLTVHFILTPSLYIPAEYAYNIELSSSEGVQVYLLGV